MIIDYPSTGTVTSSVTLPNANFGNIDRTETNSLYRESRHGDPLVADNWPHFLVKSYTVSTMDENTAETFKTFLQLVAGLKVLLTDHNGSSSIGVIATASVEFVTLKDGCSYDATFEYMVTG